MQINSCLDICNCVKENKENVQLIKLCSKSCDVSGELTSEFWFLPKMMVHVMAKYNCHLSKEHSIQFILIYIEPGHNSNHLEELYIVRQRPYNNTMKICSRSSVIFSNATLQTMIPKERFSQEAMFFFILFAIVISLI